ncbi:MAG TPA: haloacid dehalogenase-like hydrolase [Candidatus Bathyarchaeia archaeon]
MRSCALFDVDGTLLRGFIVQSFPRYLADQGVISPSFADRIDEVVRSYSSGAANYRYAAENVPSMYAEAIRGVEEAAVREHAEEYMRGHMPASIHTYARDLVEAVRRKVDLAIALSGSPTEPIQLVKALGFNQAYGSVFEARDGVYTGKILWNLILGEKKAEYAKIVAERHGFSLRRTAGFGDSDQDAQTMQLTGLPIALNPSGAMREICLARGWRMYTTETINVPEIAELVAGLREAI